MVVVRKTVVTKVATDSAAGEKRGSRLSDRSEGWVSSLPLIGYLVGHYQSMRCVAMLACLFTISKSMFYMLMSSVVHSGKGLMVVVK